MVTRVEVAEPLPFEHHVQRPERRIAAEHVAAHALDAAGRRRTAVERVRRARQVEPERCLVKLKSSAQVGVLE